MWDRTKYTSTDRRFRRSPSRAGRSSAEANQKFTEVGDTWGSLLGEIDDARESARKARATRRPR